MPRPSHDDPKTSALRQRGCLHPYPQQVADELFAASDFFDPRDLLQVKVRDAAPRPRGRLHRQP